MIEDRHANLIKNAATEPFANPSRSFRQTLAKLSLTLNGLCPGRILLEGKNIAGRDFNANARRGQKRNQVAPLFYCALEETVLSGLCAA